MRRLTITLEDYDDSKVVRSTLLKDDDDVNAALLVLNRTSVPFAIDEVGDDLYDYVLDDGSRCVDLSLRTKEEIKKWIHCEPFETCVEGFLESHSAGLRLSLDNKEAFLAIARRRQTSTC